MFKAYRFLAVFAMLGSTAAAGAADPPKDAEVTIETVTFEDLHKAIAAHKGKVVVIDIWADFCLACKERFPHVVELARAHAKDGLVLITLSTDEPDKKAAALKFLKKHNAAFQNFLLDESEENREKWEKKFPHTVIPIMHVYDRSGKLAKTFDSEKAPVIDKFIEELLKAK